MTIEIRVLGGFGVTLDGVQVPPEAWTRRHAAALVKLLALDDGHRLHRERVVETRACVSRPASGAARRCQAHAALEPVG